jgi:hypothetical protein
VCRGDNDAALIAARKGYSRRLAYLKRHQRISLSALRDVYVGREEHEDNSEPSINVLGKISSENNRSDIGTKPLDHVRHWFLLGRLKMKTLREIRAMQQDHQSGRYVAGNRRQGALPQHE